MRARLSAPAVALLLTACAAAMPGYTPPDFDGKKPRVPALESGAIGSDGRYNMSATEKEMDCKRLAGSMQITISRLKDGYIRNEPSAISSTSQKMAAPVSRGSPMTADREAVYARERAKLDAYNEELAAKDCKRIDIEAELARPLETGRRY
jgi:hypothetical protein